MPASSRRISVIVPTFRRPQELDRCLEGLARQALPPVEVVVVRRVGDEATRAVLERWTLPGLVVVEVSEPGVLAAMRAGVERATGDVIAFSDDDVVPGPGWLESLARHLDDSTVGGIGGRDHTPQSVPPFTEEVGRITRWGKHIGNHHVGAGPARDVDVLKAPGAYRREALALPARMRGQGAQVHFEIAMCRWASRHGWRLVYDPAIVVDHMPAPRFDADQRGIPPMSAIYDASYNLVAALLTVDPELFARRALYGLLVGDRANPGLVRAAAAIPRREWRVLFYLAPSLAGQLHALWDIARGRRLEMITFPRSAAAQVDVPARATEG